MAISSPKVYIIILNYNGWADTIECLESVLKNDYPNYQVIIVDNNSPNNSMNYIKAWAEGKLDIWISPSHPLRNLSFPPVKKPIPYIYYSQEEAKKGGEPKREKKLKSPIILIQTGYNGGFAYGNNIALYYILKKEKNLDNSIIWLLNPDMVVSKESLSNIARCIKSNDTNKSIYGAVVKDYFLPQKILFLGGAKIIKSIGIVRFIDSFKDLNKIDYISGGSLITTLKSFKEIGLLPEDYFLYWEDADWCTKAKKKGYKFFVCKNLIIYDKGGTSIGRKNKIGVYFYIKNALLYSKKYSKLNYFLNLAFFPIRALKAILKGDYAYIKILIEILKKRNNDD